MTPPTYTVRVAGEADVPDVVALRRHAEQWLKTAGIEQWTSSEHGDRVIKGWIGAGSTFVIEDNTGEVIGTLALDKGDPDFWTPAEINEPAIHLYKFILRSDHRGNGLGDLLLDWACYRADVHQCHSDSRNGGMGSRVALLARTVRLASQARHRNTERIRQRIEMPPVVEPALASLGPRQEAFVQAGQTGKLVEAHALLGALLPHPLANHGRHCATHSQVEDWVGGLARPLPQRGHQLALRYSPQSDHTQAWPLPVDAVRHPRSCMRSATWLAGRASNLMGPATPSSIFP